MPSRRPDARHNPPTRVGTREENKNRCIRDGIVQRSDRHERTRDMVFKFEASTKMSNRMQDKLRLAVRRRVCRQASGVDADIRVSARRFTLSYALDSRASLGRHDSKNQIEQ